MRLQAECGQVGFCRTIPDDVQDDAGEGGVGVMTVSAPICCARIDLNVTAGMAIVFQLNERALEIRTGFVIQKPGMQHAQWPAIGGAQRVALEALVLPNGLQQLFGRRMRIHFSQYQERPLSQPL